MVEIYKKLLACIIFGEYMEKTVGKRIGCATIVQKGDKIALVKRGKEPNYGLWVIPGGGLKPTDKSLEACAEREIREELGVEIVLKEKIGVYHIEDSQNNREINYYMADYKSGALSAGDDALEAKWCSKAQVKEMIHNNLLTPTVIKVLTEVGLGL